MMTTKRILIATFLLFGTVTLFSCGGNESHEHDSEGHHHSHEHHDEHTDESHSHDHSGHQHSHDHSGHDHGDQAGIVQTLNHYYELKDGLVISDVEEAKSGAKALNAHLAVTDVSVEGHESHLSEIINVMSEHLQYISLTDDLEVQREHFETVSDKLYELIQITGTQGEAVYRQYCPMAFDDKGAYWLSAQEEIRNPYFGDAMLACGSVEEEL